MRRHRISESDVVAATIQPEYTEPSVEGRVNAWLKISERFIRVPFKEEEDHFLIVTAVMKKKDWR
jgi:hypothetical protein